MFKLINSCTSRRIFLRKRWIIIGIEYIKIFSSLETEDALFDDDWVSCRCRLGDTKAHLLNNQAESITSSLGHNRPVWCVAVIHSDECEHHFLSGSHNQTIIIWRYDQNRNDVQSLVICKGYQATIETLESQKFYFVSRSVDKTIKLWG